MDQYLGYSVPTKMIIQELLLRLKYTFGDSNLYYIGTTTNLESGTENLSDIDVMLVFNDKPNESYIGLVWKIINKLHTKYNIVLDTRIYDIKELESISDISKFLLHFFLNDLFGQNPFSDFSIKKDKLNKQCLAKIKEQETMIIKILPRIAGDAREIKLISQCVYDAIRAFLIINGHPLASKEESTEYFNVNYPDFGVKAIYDGYLNPSHVTDVTNYLMDSLGIVKHLYYKAEQKSMSNEVLLINTPGAITSHPRNDYLANDHNMPLGLVCIGSYLQEEGYSVKILDSYAENLGALSTIDRIFSNEKIPKVIGFNTTSPNIHIVHKICSYIKRINNNVVIVAGGAHATLAKEHTLKDGFIDYCIEGEGEIPFKRLVEAIFNDVINEDNIPGVYSCISGKIVGTPNTFEFDLNRLPTPQFQMLPIEKYFAVKRRLYIHSSRGCAFNCIYCSVPQCWNRKVKEIPIELLISQLKDLISLYQPLEIQIVDDNFSHNKGRLIRQFCTRLNEENIHIRWKCQARADQLDEHLVKMMANSGCFEIDLGIESGNKDIQRYIRKGLDLEKTLEVIRMINDSDIYTKAFFMVGFPNDDFDTLTDTINYSISLKEKGLKDVAFFPVMPFPGTEISKQVGKVVYQGAVIDKINVYERSFASNRLKKYSARPEISLNQYFSPEQLRLLVKFAYTRFYYEKLVFNLQQEFADFLLNEEEGFYSV